MTPAEFLEHVRKVLLQYDEGAVFDHEAAIAIIAKVEDVDLSPNAGY